MGWYFNTTPDSAEPDRFSGRYGACDADEIRRQLARILASDQFRDALRLTRFLSFVVEQTLAGKSDNIKAYTIAVEALGRSQDFDPQNDAIVRVEGGRLRRALARYYAEAGRDDPVVIDLPLGGYVPKFRRRGGANRPPQIVGQNSSLASADVGPGYPAQHLGRMDQFNRQVLASFELARVQSGRIAEFSAVVRSVNQTLRQSQDLLKSGAQLDPTRPAAPQAPAAEGIARTLDVPGAGSDEEAQSAPFPSPRLQPEQPRTASPKRTIRVLIATAARHLRAHSRTITIALAAIAVLAVLEALFEIDHPLVGGPNHGLVQRYLLASDATAPQPQSNEGAPVIYAAPVTAVGSPVGEALSPGMIRQRFVDALTLYDDVTVVTQEPQPRPGATASAPETGGTNSPIYRLSATVRDYPDGSVMSLVQLTDTTDGTIAWSKTYQRPGKRDASRRGIVAPDLAQSLLGPFGVIEARERIKRAAVSPMHDTYRCILDANFYLRSFNPSQYQPVHDCLLHASTKAPPEVTVFADLAFVYLRNYRFGISSRPGDRTMLDDAYAAAARAVDIKPNSAFAQYALQEVSLAGGDIERAKIAGDNSFRLNPSDSAIAFGHAELLILTGEVPQSIALLKQTSATSPNSWIGYHVLMALGCYLQGDFNSAGAEARQIANPFFPPGLVLDALAATKTGDRARAQQDIAMLSQFYPAWRENIRASVVRFLPDPAMADRIAADFQSAAAGLAN